MKVYAFVKIRVHPDADGPGTTYGDIICFERMDRSLSKTELIHFLPVPMDIKIPCGDDYMKSHSCPQCKNNDIALCDVQKYCRAEFSDGGVLEEPQLLKKRRFKIDIDKEISKPILDIAKKRDKTDVEDAKVKSDMDKITILESKIEDKATLQVIS
jgi:hypothetical protein